ncbi:2-oxoacid:acceptor oxidoreductase subunit alpha [Iocasia frigidifontis]|uniref:2-oxoacid:acceptor oxidoreductase subunit alpha n=1 Tax=Iocasia fonsfrigidae TaxID=2682810 RepID=A0A8A7K4F5_9FIRM|nr:2-oxoacid:acceptor oxidoreductase subunit alpha [Iocasia fonsfrigidae]QTL96603.1 2-oxoacid:acceptor oxidoreductase subunit alpha [Iocasia fonsfrigidae]
MDLNILIAGEAGQGLKTIETILGKTLFRMGFQIYTTRDYMSRIRGGHNFVKIRIGKGDITGPAEEIDVLLALNEEAISQHKQDLKEDGIIVLDGQIAREDIYQLINIPARKIANEVNSKALNTVFVGAVLKVLNLKIAEALKVIKEHFTDKKLQEDNMILLKEGFKKADGKFSLPKIEDNDEQLFIDGNSAVALGALAAGVKFFSAYPMSPSTGIMNYLAAKQKEQGIVVEQAEDEIAAINMTLGASYAGVRAMTATSGGGLALMAESVGLAGITETPLVIVDVQRPGPATGLPTRTEQGDLLFSINIAQGEFPLMVISPRDSEDAFYQTFRAFNLADKYQLPVILLSDQFLADSTTNINHYNLNSLKIETSLITDGESVKYEDYKRYQITEDGISPRAYPGQLSGEVVLVDSDEHDENGDIVESASARSNMVDKRMKKLVRIKQELKEPVFFGQEDINYLIIGWGSTYGPILEARKLLMEDGYKIGYLSFTDLWPLPEKRVKKIITPDIKVVVVENNATGQFAQLLKGQLGITSDYRMLKYNGRPFSGREIYQRMKEEVII